MIMETRTKRTVRILISVPVFPTEDCERMLHNLSKLFPKMDLQKTQNDCNLHGEGTAVCDNAGSGDWHGVLENFQARIFAQKTLDAFRKKLRSNTTTDDLGKTTTFVLLNKQAALVGRINLVGEDESIPLGTLRLEVESGNTAALEDFIDWLAPRTKKGIPIVENQ